MTGKMKQTAYFACGCFWHPEHEFSKFGETEVGYMGGDEKKFPNPTYEQVCSDKTGYAETVKIVFEEVSYDELLDVFWRIHDPTQLNRQGADIGSQYRSAIFYVNAEQKKKAEKSKKKQERKLGKKIVTEIKKAEKFFKAEDYHQKYLQKGAYAISNEK